MVKKFRDKKGCQKSKGYVGRGSKKVKGDVERVAKILGIVREDQKLLMYDSKNKIFQPPPRGFMNGHKEK